MNLKNVNIKVLNNMYEDLYRKVVTHKCQTIKGDVDRAKKMFKAVEAELFGRIEREG